MCPSYPWKLPAKGGVSRAWHRTAMTTLKTSWMRAWICSKPTSYFPPMKSKKNRICFWSTIFCKFSNIFFMILQFYKLFLGTSNCVWKNWPQFPTKKKRNVRFLRKPWNSLPSLETTISPWTHFSTSPKMLLRELSSAITWPKWDKKWEIGWWKKSLAWAVMANLPNGGFALPGTAANSWKFNWMSRVKETFRKCDFWLPLRLVK